MVACNGDELHEHYSLATEGVVEHRHIHDMRSVAFNNLHHHSPEDHHMFTDEELSNEERIIERSFSSAN